MDILLGLASLAALALFLAYICKKSASVTPLVAVAIAMLWFTLMGCFGLLLAAGWLWYAGCAAALGWVIFKQKKDILKLVTPGFALFCGLGVAFALLFFFTRPMLTQWDEFTVWGTAGKVLSTTNQLYSTARSNLFANVAPPGLAVFSYMVQFFSFGFAEYKFMAAFAFIYLAAFAAATALWDKTRYGAIAAMGGMVLLPILFQPANGSMAMAYLGCMADLPMAVLFGGALCLYFGGGRKDEKLLLGVGLVLAALTNLKDMGLALALLAFVIIAADMLFCQRTSMRFFGLRKGKSWLAAAASQLVLLVLPYAGWELHMRLVSGVNRGNIGSGGQSLSRVDMLLNGVKALLGIQPDAVFDKRAVQMLDAFLRRPVWLFGSGAVLLVVVVAILNFAWVFSTQKRHKRQVLVFGIFSLLGFFAYYIFLLFTYTYVFSSLEGDSLAAYDRYVTPYWIGWVMASMVLLAQAALRPAAQLQSAKTQKKKTAVKPLWRPVAARAVSLALCAALLFGVALRGNWRANFMQVSPSQYTNRLNVQQVVQTARAQGMQQQDVVYLVSQGDNAGRFYLFAYEMESKLTLLYGGEEKPNGTQASSLIKPGSEHYGYAEAVQCSPQQLFAYLKEAGCTHILLDVTDGYIIDAFGPYFSDGLAGWTNDNSYKGGHRYYAIQWQGEEAHFVPVEGGAAA